MTDKSWEELRAAYLARVLDVSYGRTLSAVRAWNRFSDQEKIEKASRIPSN